MRMTARNRQDAIDGLLVNRNVAGSTALADEHRELGRRNDPERQRACRAIQRLIPIGKDLPHEVLTAAQKDVCDIGLRLKNRAQERRQMLVDVDDLLKLVQNEHDAALALTCDALRQFEQLL